MMAKEESTALRQCGHEDPEIIPGRPELVSADKKGARVWQIAENVAAVLAGTGVAALPRKAQANTVGLRPDAEYIRLGQLMQGHSNGEYVLTYVVREPGTAARKDVYRKPIAINSTGPATVNLQSLGPSVPQPGVSYPDSDETYYLEIPLPDGSIVKFSGAGDFDMYSTGRCGPSDEDTCPDLVHPSRIPGQIKYVARNFPDAELPDFMHDVVYRVPTDTPHFPTYIRNQIAAANAAGQDSFHAGILHYPESSGARGYGAMYAPETARLLAVSRGGMRASEPYVGTWLYEYVPETGETFPLARNIDGTSWHRSGTGMGRASSPELGVVTAMIDTTDSANGAVMLEMGGGPHVRVLRYIDPGNFAELTATLDTDDDRDGVPNFEADGVTPQDNCRYRTNPTQVDSDHDSVGDACAAVCPTYPPDTPDPATVTSYGLVRCSPGTPSSLGPTVRMDHTGSTFYTSGPEVIIEMFDDPPPMTVFHTLPQPGETGGYIHSSIPYSDTAARPILTTDIVFPTGYSVDVTVKEGVGTLTRAQYNPETRDLETVTVTPGTGPRHIDVVAPGAVLGLEGSQVEWVIGTIRTEIACPPLPAVYCAPTVTDGGDRIPYDGSDTTGGHDATGGHDGVDSRDTRETADTTHHDSGVDAADAHDATRIDALDGGDAQDAQDAADATQETAEDSAGDQREAQTPDVQRDQQDNGAERAENSGNKGCSCAIGAPQYYEHTSSVDVGFGVVASLGAAAFSRSIRQRIARIFGLGD